MKSGAEIIAKIKELVEEYEESYGEYDYDDEWPYEITDELEEKEYITQPTLVQQWFSDKLVALSLKGDKLENIFSDASISFYGCAEDWTEQKLAGNDSIKYGCQADVKHMRSGKFSVFEVVSNTDSNVYFGGSVGSIYHHPMTVTNTECRPDNHLKINSLEINMGER